MHKRGRARGWGRTLALSALLLLASGLLSWAPGIRDLELRLTDSYFRVAPVPRQPPSAVLVLIDDESLRQVGRWPWSRSVLADLIHRLSQGGATAVGLDILFAEPQSPATDAALQAALGKNTVLADKIGSYPEGPRWTEPLPALAAAAGGVGHAQAPLDRDGICRRFPPLELSADGPRWAFAVELARRVDPQRTAAFLSAYGVAETEDAGPVRIVKPVLVPIAYRPDAFQTLSAVSLLRGGQLTGVRGRPVLVGFGSTEIADRLMTPVSGEFPMPGVVLHAQIFDAILGGRTLHEVPLGWQAILLGGICLGSVLLLRRRKGWSAATALLALAIAVYGGGLLGFVKASRILPVGPMMLALLLAPLVVYSSEFVMVERSLGRQLRELRSWLAARSGGRPDEKHDLAWRLGVLHDLQAQLGSLYELHSTLLESTHDLIAIFDNEGRLLLRNGAFGAVFGDDATPGVQLEKVRARWAPDPDVPLVESGGRTEGEAHVGEALYFVRIAPLPATALTPGGGTVVTLSDLAARVERDRARSEALGFVTHELRTPLVSIQGFAEVMMEYPGSPACAGAPQTIFRESRRLLALINSYLDMLRLDAGARPMHPEAVDLDAVVRQVFDILEPLAAANGMRLRYDIAGLWATGDEPLLVGAVLNLVSNAIKYGVSDSDIRVACAATGSHVALSVENRGDPIRESELERLQEPFYRGSEAEQSRSGWGLGLAFVKRIAEKHGGRVEVRNTQDGVIFTVHLPAAVRAVAAREAP